MTSVRTCAAVTSDTLDETADRAGWDQAWWGASIGDLLWNPKMGEGHVLVAEVRCGTEHNGRVVNCGCGERWGPSPPPCPSTAMVCECGEDNSLRDHHYVILPKPRWCLAVLGAMRCQRPKGHRGSHAAAGTGDSPNDDGGLVRWPRKHSK